MADLKSRIPFTWNQLVGDSNQFSRQNRAFNSISVLTLFLLCFLLPFNLILGLQEVSLALVILIVLQAFFYYLSRFKKRYKAGSVFYIAATYLVMIVTFYYNSGSLGPIMLLFFLSFNLLIAFTPRRTHYLWAILHLALPIILLTAEYLYPDLIKDTYSNRQERFIDILSSYLVTLVCVYLITNYLRNNWEREKVTAEERADKIALQNEHIVHQNTNLDELNQKKDKLFSIISHDLQSPLHSILSTLELLAEFDLSEADQKKLAEGLLIMTRNTANMLSNLLTWSKNQISGVNFSLTEVSIATLVERVLSVQTLLARKKDCRVSTYIDAAAVVHTDINMLELIVRNLINNAIKFTREGGEIIIRTELKAGECILSVKDTGIGMTREQEANLFTLSSRSTYGTNNEKGIGLGLMLCKELTELLNGKLWYETIEGVGTTFYLSLPQGKPASKSIPQPARKLVDGK
ncbi:HAMP domain-containing histidine kinase [Chitinophaga horti]|uniref:histidine kinase n=1 Tax=Chitinophaga horti TaxID=2920382 RepID=A0ABY6IVI4_9BACT|nr:HAMP domain-containing sensor histidine kinase [Chitinophaga horti]UYQ91369.1 HAMP domain-containing histidine kinase [Chitinophaga horti]